MAAYTFRSINKNQLGWHSDMGGDVLEWLFADGWMDNGYKYNFLFSSKLDTAENVVGPEKKDWPIVALLITSPEGETKHIYKAFPPEEFKAEETWGATIGNNVFRGLLTPDGMPAGYQVKIDLDDVGLDITAKAICTGVRLVEEEHGYIYYDPTENIGVRWWPLVPRASIEGTITFQGKKIPAAGLGYVERQLGNNQGKKMSEWVSHWFWQHFYAGDYTAVYTYAAASEMLQYRPLSPLILWKGSDIILCTHNLSLSPDKFELDDVTGCAYPTIETIHATQGNIELLGLVQPPTLFERYQMLNLPGQTLENAGCILRGFSDIDVEITRLDKLELMRGKCMYEHGQITRWTPIPRK